MISQLTYDSLRLIKQNGRLLDLRRARFAAGEGTCLVRSSFLGPSRSVLDYSPLPASNFTNW